MNGTARPDKEANILYLAMGSNINPHKNIPLALQRLKSCCDVLNISSVWETHAEGSAGQNFLNLVLCVSTSEDLESFKLQELRRIETELQRVRSSDKNAPRTMDIDILIFNGMVLEPSIWNKVFLAVPLAEMIPELINPQTGQTLESTSGAIQTTKYIDKVSLSLDHAI